LRYNKLFTFRSEFEFLLDDGVNAGVGAAESGGADDADGGAGFKG
jgi:hypothetical protein